MKFPVAALSILGAIAITLPAFAQATGDEFMSFEEGNELGRFHTFGNMLATSARMGQLQSLARWQALMKEAKRAETDGSIGKADALFEAALQETNSKLEVKDTGTSSSALRAKTFLALGEANRQADRDDVAIKAYRECIAMCKTQLATSTKETFHDYPFLQIRADAALALSGLLRKSGHMDEATTLETQSKSDLDLLHSEINAGLSSFNMEPAKASHMNDVDFGPYMFDMGNRIRQHWFPISAENTYRTILQFKVKRDGSISNLRIDVPSSRLKDQCALAAVQDASPLPPLPEGAPDDVDIQYTFTYTASK